MHNKRIFLIIAAVVFMLVALLHLLRLINGWPVMLGNCTIPMWVSWPGLVATSLLSGWGFMLARKS